MEKKNTKDISGSDVSHLYMPDLKLRMMADINGDMNA